MTRGTTPTLKFTTPFTADQVESGYITFTTQKNILLDISVNDDNVKIEDNFISLTLTQSQTLMFKSCVCSLVQLRLLLGDGNAVASNIVQINVCDILKDGEI